MPRPVSLVYPAAIYVPIHGYSFGPNMSIGSPIDSFGLTIYGDRAHACETTLEVVFVNLSRIVVDDPAPVMCPACLVHRRAVVMMRRVNMVRFQCPECDGVLDDRLHGEAATVHCVCGDMPHDETCPMFPRSY